MFWIAPSYPLLKTKPKLKNRVNSLNKEKCTFNQIPLKGTRASKSKTDKINHPKKTKVILHNIPFSYTTFKNFILLIALSGYRIKSVAFLNGQPRSWIIRYEHEIIYLWNRGDINVLNQNYIWYTVLITFTIYTCKFYIYQFISHSSHEP